MERTAASAMPAGRFVSVWLANLVSNLGDGLYQFALPVMALGLTGSPGAVAGVTVMLTLAWPLFGLQAGSVVDHFDRRKVMVIVNGVRVVVLGVLSWAILTDSLSLPLLYAVALPLGIGETLVDTALTSIVPSVVPRERLEWANGRIAAGQTVTNTFLGPPLAGTLMGIGWGVATGAATALYGVAVGALALLNGSYRATPSPVAADAKREGRLMSMAGGFRFLWRDRLLRRLTLFTAAMNVWWAAWTAVFVVYAVRPGPMGLSTVGYGLLLTAMAVGGLLGSLITTRIVTRMRTRRALLLDHVGTILLVGVPAFTTNAIAVGGAVLVAGFGAAVWVVAVASIRQRRTPDALLGRVYSASRMVSWGVLPLGAGLGGAAAELIGVPTLFAVGALVSVVVLVGFLLSFHERDFAIDPAQAPAP